MLVRIYINKMLTCKDIINIMVKFLIDRLSLVMKSNNLNQNQLSKLMGVSPVQVSHWLNGRNNPNLESLQNLASVLDKLNLHWLLTGEGEMYLKSDSEILAENKQLKKEKSLFREMVSHLNSKIEETDAENKILDSGYVDVTGDGS